VRLLFQPAEESPGGAPLMIEEGVATTPPYSVSTPPNFSFFHKGCLDGVDEVYGMHNWPTVELGTLLYAGTP
jgi:metal-dependent amidase/aminoacylase/carboxypeptidase family protein